MQRGMRGHYDPNSETVTLEGATLNLKGLKQLTGWLMQVQRAMTDAETKADGGIRWEFRREHADAPMAMRMHGKTRMADLYLVEIRPRRESRCEACRESIKRGTMCWRQKTGQYSGHSMARFCDRCVKGGRAPERPKLQLIMGGA